VKKTKNFNTMTTIIQRFGKLAWYVFLLVGGAYLISSDAIIGIFDALHQSDEGVLLKIAHYFKDADTWNLIFLLLFFCPGLGLFMLINLGVDRAFKALARRSPRLAFLNSAWADFLLQNTAAVFILLLLFVGTTYGVVCWHAQRRTLRDVAEIQTPKPVFVLGTSKMLTSGKGENAYYRARINAAADLYRHGKAKFFILSGDGGEGRTDDYDETRDMELDLLAQGIPAAQIKKDTAGFRTLDSILRLRALFHLDSIIIVSQAFHTPRAIFLSSFYGIDAQAYIAKGGSTFAMARREAASRPKMLLDLLFFNMQPRVTTPDGEAFLYREDFELKSDLHVLIVLSLVVLCFCMIMGYGIVVTKRGAERARAVKRFALVGSLTALSIVGMISQVYKNLDIRFLDEAVEMVAKIVGVQTRKMEEKQIQGPVVVREEKEILPPAATVPEPDTAIQAGAAEPLPEFNTAEAASPTVAATAPVVEKSGGGEGDEDPFNSSSGTMQLPMDSEAQPVAKGPAPDMHIVALVHDTKTITNDGTILLRLAEPVNLGGKSYPVKFIFEAKTIVLNERFILICDALGGTELRNVQGGREGYRIEARHRSKKGQVTLAEGESITLTIL
jgi:SanA protein